MGGSGGRGDRSLLCALVALLGSVGLGVRLFSRPGYVYVCRVCVRVCVGGGGGGGGGVFHFGVGVRGF